MEDYRIDGLTVKEHLLEMAEKGNKAFVERLNPGVEHILGVRSPDLRKLAVRIAKGDWECYLRSADTFYMEERMLQGMVLSNIKPLEDVEAYLHLVTSFVWNINSWSVCDTFQFAGGKKFFEANKERIWAYLDNWLDAKGVYERRFGIVMMMQLFIEESSIHRLLAAYERVDLGKPCTTCTPACETYYVKMAMAWALSECYVKFPEQTLTFLQTASLDRFTYNKTLQKIIESYRVSPEQKETVRSMRKNGKAQGE